MRDKEREKGQQEHRRTTLKRLKKMKESRKTHTVKKGRRCDICGAANDPDVILTCHICQSSFEHMYCMRRNLLEVPGEWSCESCSSSRNVALSPDSQSSNSNRKGCTGNCLPDIGSVKKVLASPRSPATNPFPKKNYCKKVETGKVRYLEAEDVVALASGTDKTMPSASRCGFKSKGGLSNNVHSSITKSTSVSVADASKCRSGPIKPSMVGRVKKMASLQQLIRTSSKLHNEASPSSLPCKTLRSPSLSKRDTEDVRSVPIEDSVRSELSPRKLLSPTHARHREQVAKDRFNGPSFSIRNTEDLPTMPVEAPLRSELSPRKLLSPTHARHRDHISQERFNEPKSLTSAKPSGKENNVDLRKVGEAHKERGASSPPSELPQNVVYKAQNVSSPPVESPSASAKFEEVQNHPAIDSTWKGSFEVRDSDSPVEFYGGLRAHPPGKVSAKVYEYSKQMPLMLQFKLVPRGDVRSELYDIKRVSDLKRQRIINCPTGVDIALYFLPSDYTRFRERYFSLLEHMEKKDLVMQSCMDRVELLIFTSHKLPMDSQRIKTDFFLWGVFWPPKIKLSKGSPISLMKRPDEPIERLNLAVPEVHPLQSVKGTAVPLLKVKTEGPGDTDGPPGFLRSLGTSDGTHKGLMEMPPARVQNAANELESPPGFLRPLGTSGATQKGLMEMPFVRIPNVANQLESPPGFSRPLKLKQRSDSLDSYGKDKALAVDAKVQSLVRKESMSFNNGSGRVFKESSSHLQVPAKELPGYMNSPPMLSQSRPPYNKDGQPHISNGSIKPDSRGVVKLEM